MSHKFHQQFLNEATRYGTLEVLRHMPAAYCPELEQTIRHGVRQAVLYYAAHRDIWSRQLHPTDGGKATS